MKKVISSLISVLFVLIILYPTGSIISGCFGYRLELISLSAFSIVIALFSLCVVILDLVFKNDSVNVTVQILLVILTPLSLFTAAAYIVYCPKIWVILSGFSFMGCCGYLTVKHLKPLVIKTITLVISALMVLPIGFICFIALFFGNLGENTVVKSVKSPSGEYYAQVIDSDQGALGGDTFVDVYKNSGINLIIFKIEKNPQRVYFGDWGEFENMKIHWKDDRCLVINSIEYEIE